MSAVGLAIQEPPTLQPHIKLLTRNVLLYPTRLRHVGVGRNLVQQRTAYPKDGQGLAAIVRK